MATAQEAPASVTGRAIFESLDRLEELQRRQLVAVERQGKELARSLAAVERIRKALPR